MGRFLVAALSGAAAALLVVAIVGSVLLASVQARKAGNPSELETADAMTDAVETGAKAGTAAAAVASSEPRLGPGTPVPANPAGSAPANPGEITSRTVRSIPIGPDGKPIFASVVNPGPSPAAGAGQAAPLSFTSTAALAAVPGDPAIAEPEAPVVVAPIPRTRPESFNEVATAPSGDVRSVGGSGVNVRSGPTSSADTLFVLGAGASVTVLDKERGWLKVVDEDGRSGWAYGDFID
jgi:hypothetical protein